MGVRVDSNCAFAILPFSLFKALLTITLSWETGSRLRWPGACGEDLHVDTYLVRRTSLSCCVSFMFAVHASLAFANVYFRLLSIFRSSELPLDLYYKTLESRFWPLSLERCSPSLYVHFRPPLHSYTPCITLGLTQKS